MTDVTTHKPSRRLHCPHPDYPDAWVDVPGEWTGEHLQRRDLAARAAARYRNGKITIAAIAICIVDGWGGIPGLEGRDTAAWHFERVPIPLIVWLEMAVFDDFAKAFAVPKASWSPWRAGLEAIKILTKRAMGGSSRATR